MTATGNNHDVPRPAPRQLPDKKKLRQFEVVALGCHERARKEIAEHLVAQWHLDTFLFVEYFCIDPIPLATPGQKPEQWKNAQLFFPFLRRVLEDNQFVWVRRQRYEYRLRARNQNVRTLFRDPAAFSYGADKARVGDAIITWWAEQDHWPPKVRAADQEPWPPRVPAGKQKLPVEHYQRNEWKQYLEWVGRTEEGDEDVIWKDYGLAGEPWRRSCRRTLVVGVPIASHSIF